ncbi:MULTISPECIES: L-fucose isomerase [Caldilinea]|jgi:L-fucose isomerase|uniref:L-fucose isomerase n=1 Tax=Caldilinea aerophila (strain DSM 14535 / JCM 11387 / NBRC 104270 / STL-6-O1) TaxID=926550 RepID=I0I4U2_CALAS|nr:MULTISPECIES: L-fucose isomerase [Caldilinea]MBO9391786.1 L-fucose isomerase [Caldilinea sp.]BAM00280.1 L-fucose isomerase [Caldilinea aerophila DSM 14535 = NBRC 104270]GIV71638.1 MAG: L-fucose isomerase [Caldilinea sp.]
MKVNPPTNHLIGAMPKIGIRPTIDGRLGGVRESLEEQTMTMARTVARFLSENLRHYNGLPVECVIADTTIGGVAEAAATAEKFRREGVGVSLTVTPCWCYGSETMDMDPHLPKAVWGFNGTERPGAVYLAAVSAAHNQKGLPVFNIYGRDVQDVGDTTIPSDVQEKLLRFARAGLAVANMRGKSYLGMGGVSMGIAGSIVNHDFLERWLGMRVETIDMVEFVRRIQYEIYDKEEFERAYAWVRANCVEGKDYNPPDKQRSRAQKDEDWATSVKMALIARDLMIGNPKLREMGFGEEALGHNAIAAGFQGQRQWTDFLPNGDFMEAILTSSFDWNGIRPPFIVATENDALNGISMLFIHLLTNAAAIFADVRTYWSPEAVKRVTGYELTGRAAGGILHLINSGPAALDGTGQQSRNGEPAMKPFWEITPEEAEACLKATTWHAAMTEYFRGGGWSTRFRTRGGMPVTMIRINLVQGLGPALQIAEGWTVDLPDEVHTILDERTNPTWPTTWFVPRTTGSGPFRDVYTVMNNWGANHGAIGYGHFGADVISLASMLRIPVYMHNVDETAIFRPSAWTLFGANEPMGADFRACANFGPLYG